MKRDQLSLHNLKAKAQIPLVALRHDTTSTTYTPKFHLGRHVTCRACRARRDERVALARASRAVLVTSYNMADDV